MSKIVLITAPRQTTVSRLAVRKAVQNAYETALKTQAKAKEKYGVKITVKKELNSGAIINADHPKNKEANRFLKKFDLNKM